jgi:hypothetical protein
MTKGKPSHFERAQVVIRQMVDMERELTEIGLHATARKVNAAQQKIGWELAEKTEKAKGG